MVPFLIWYVSSGLILVLLLLLGIREEKKEWYYYRTETFNSRFEGFPYYLIFIPLFNFLLIFSWILSYISLRKEVKQNINHKMKAIMFDNMVHLL